MKLKTAALVASMLLTLSANAGPFGVNPGDPIREEGVADNGLIFEVLEHGSFGGFESIAKYGTRKTGTCAVRAFKNFLDTNGAGLAAQAFFHGVADKLTNKYGALAIKKDALQAGSIRDRSQDWIESFAVGERELAYTWSNSDNAPIDIIELYVVGESTYSVHVNLQYWFNNYEQCTEDIEQVF